LARPHFLGNKDVTKEEAMKKLVLLLVVVLFAGCAAKVLSPVETQRGRIDAEFWIRSWHMQSDKSVLGFYGIRNTGNVPIGYWQVYFEATCEDGSKYHGRGWGPMKGETGDVGRPLSVARELGGWFVIYTSGNKVKSIRIYDWNIRRHY
jgi:hypothetical protein